MPEGETAEVISSPKEDARKKSVSEVLYKVSLILFVLFFVCLFFVSLFLSLFVDFVFVCLFVCLFFVLFCFARSCSQMARLVDRFLNRQAVAVELELCMHAFASESLYG